MNDRKLNEPAEYEPHNTPTDPPIETLEDWDKLRGKIRINSNTWRSPSRRYYHGANDDVW